MKRIIEDEALTGMESLLGETVTLFCVNYFYTGKLTGVNTDCVELTNPAIVYETGAWEESSWADCQRLPGKTLFVNKVAIEAFGVTKIC